MRANGDPTIERDLKNLVIATLCPDKKDQVSLDLYLNVSQNITIACQSESESPEVHLSGYFEPNNSLDELGAGGIGGFPLDDDDDEEDEEEQIEIPTEEVKILKKDAVKPVTAGKQVAAEKKGGKDTEGSGKTKTIEKSMKEA